ncbi:M48 family metallopeptidase [Sphaerisporangium fuscum]|uniref:M48 family metallopeptidase n=1 Tax=Sphaerisporangium fuscum TaxID=2835868 RepID=UPI001BDC1463|nr:M48 family metallopeptidase [Sphaerisporangium fuscum]
MITVKRTAAVCISLVVHGLTLAMITVGVLIIYAAPGFLPAWLLGGLFAGLGILLFPRPRRLPADAEMLTPSSAPETYGVARRVAEAVGARPPAAVTVRDLAVACEYAEVGWWRRPVLVVGLPLWLVLSPRERVVLLALTCAERSGHDLLVSGALWTLAQWRGSMSGGGPLKKRDEAHTYVVGVLAGFAPPGSYQAAGTLGLVVGAVIGWPALLLERLLLRLTRERDGRTVRRPGMVTEAEATRLAGLMRDRYFLAPVQAAVLRGASAAEIRQAALTRSDQQDEDTSAGERSLLDPAASAAIDEELAVQYARAIRGFGLIS